MKFAEITMQSLGVDIHRDAFTVKLTGGPDGDVAGNAMRILLDRCPRAQIRLILDGTAALVDPEGASAAELRRILLAQDLDAFDPQALHLGGMMLFRTGTRKEGLRELYRKVTRTPIANLLLTEQEFLENKQRYVRGVLDILERRAADEARLILARRRDQGQLCTEISDSLSGEINAHYARLFRFFQARPELALTPPFRRAILSHLPAILREEPRFRQRLAQLPPKYRSAILAAEIGSSLVYRGDREAEFEDMIRLHLTRNFPVEPEA
jgi:hypothetical protein